MEIQPAKILVVDDDGLNRSLLMTYLNNAGHDVEVAPDGLEALLILREKPFDLVLLDLMMPAIDGYQVLYDIKKDPTLRHIPVLVMSGNENMESIVRSIQMGAVDFLPKPIDPVLMQARIDSSLYSKRLHDIELKYTANLQAQNEELESFIQAVAHDLKSPLTVIEGYSKSLVTKRDQLSEENLAHYHSSIHRGVKKVFSIIDALLLLSHLRGDQKAELVPLEMDSILDECQMRLQHLVNQYQAEVVLPPSWPKVIGHAGWVEEVWVNYMSNGLKYGGRPARIELGSDSTEDGMVRFWLRDNGNGLSLKEQEQVFIPFIQFQKIRVDGHGLGLSIVDRIVTRLGGEVGVNSDGKYGCTFWFTLPAMP